MLLKVCSYYQLAKSKQLLTYKYMSNDPNEKEVQALDSLAKTGRFHSKLLVATLVFVGIVFIAPKDFQVLIAVPAIILIVIFSFSFVNLQYFQRCPRCKTRRNMHSGSCGKCGMNFYPTKTSTSSKWLE